MTTGNTDMQLTDTLFSGSMAHQDRGTGESFPAAVFAGLGKNSQTLRDNTPATFQGSNNIFVNIVNGYIDLYILYSLNFC